MWGGYFLNYCARQAVFAMFPALKADLVMNDSQLGLLGSLFLWVYCLCNPVAGKMGDRFSKRRLVVLSLVAWSVATIITGFAGSPTTLLILRSLFAMAEVLFMPAALALTANAFLPAKRSRAIAVLLTAQIAGTVSGSWFGGWMAQQGSWRGAFFTIGAVGLVYAVPYLLFLRREIVEDEVKTAETPASLPLRALVKVPTLMLLCAVSTSFGFGLWLIYGWLQNFLHEKFSLGLSDAAFNATVFLQGAALVGLLCGGLLADWLYLRTKAARLWILAAGLFLCAPCLHALGSSGSLADFRLAALGFGLFSGFLMGNIFPAVFDVVPAASRATAVGLVNFCGFVSGFAPLLGGLWKQTVGIDSLFSRIAIVYLIFGLLLIAGIKLLFPRDFARAH